MRIQTEISFAPKLQPQIAPQISDEAEYLKKEMKEAVDKLREIMGTKASDEEKRSLVVIQTVENQVAKIRQAANIWNPVLLDPLMN